MRCAAYHYGRARRPRLNPSRGFAFLFPPAAPYEGRIGQISLRWRRRLRRRRRNPPAAQHTAFETREQAASSRMSVRFVADDERQGEALLVLVLAALVAVADPTDGL